MNDYKRIEQEISKANQIVITAHKSPDGDSIGSSLGLYHFIKALGRNVVVCHPDPSPAYLNWVEGADNILNAQDHKEEVQTEIDKADLIFCLDYNSLNRLGERMEEMLQKSDAKKVMIDHHLHPDDFSSITISEPSACSTSQLIVELIDQSGHLKLLNALIGTPLYLGIMTDSGSFRFPSVLPRTHEVLAELLRAGVKHSAVHENLYDSNTLSGLRLRGYALSNKLEIVPEYPIALIALSEEELNRFNYEKGDTEGLVNIALSIQGIKIAVFFSEKEGKVKMSFRSKGKDNPVNMLASENFEGGGHANAAGGISSLALEETVQKFKNLIPKYFKK
jgi:phosphoesterase RecJ-like protein